MTRKFKLLFLIASFLLISSVFFLHAETHLEIVFDLGNRPLMFQDKGNKINGIYPLITEAVFKKMNMPVDLTTMPWTRAIDSIDSGKTGLGGLYKNKTREEKYDFSDPIYRETLLLYTHRDNAFPFNHISDLKGKKIGVVLGWSYGDAFDQAKKEGVFKTEDANNDYINLKKLVDNRLDIIIAAPETVELAIEEMGLKNHIIRLPVPVTINDTFIAFHKSANKKDVLEKFNKALAELKADGTYDKLKVITPDMK